MSYLPCIGSLEPFEPPSLGAIFGSYYSTGWVWVGINGEELTEIFKPKVQTVWIVDDDD